MSKSPATETLHTCPKCGQGGFSMKGLNAHHGTKACQRRAAAALTLMPKAPALKSGRDSQAVAAQLDELITDAESGLRRIVRAGLFILEVCQDLPRGQFCPWIEAHLPHRCRRTVLRWKALALNIMESCGLKVTQCHLSQSLHEVLALPMAEVPADAQEVRSKIDELIEGKSYRQLFFEFKQAEEQTDEDGETTLVPTHGGDVTPRDANGKRKAKRRRTNLEITTESFETDSEAALLSITTAFDTLFAITGPKGERAWDTLKPKDLEALKLQAKDLHEAILATQTRRNQAASRRA